jgi:hypothetical protein
MGFLVSFGRFYVRMMILSYGLFKWWIWVRKFGISIGDLWKNLGLRLKITILFWYLNLKKLQFSPQTLKNIYIY